MEEEESSVEAEEDLAMGVLLVVDLKADVAMGKSEGVGGEEEDGRSK